MSEEPEVIHHGLDGVVVDTSSISKVMPQINSLVYRGYPVQELAEHCHFEEVAWLIWRGELPKAEELKAFMDAGRGLRDLSKDLLAVIQKSPRTAHPMDVLRTAVSFLGMEDAEMDKTDAGTNLKRSVSLMAKIPTMLAAFYRFRKGQEFIPPRSDLGFVGNFFHMVFGQVPVPEVVKAFEVSMVLYAEHGFNASTFTARTVVSSLSDIYSGVVGGIASLKGALHGGANEAVMHMLLEIGEPARAKEWMLKALREKRVVMGFGHRVYKNGDSRVPTMKKYARKMAEFTGETRWLDMEDILEAVMLEQKKIHPNLDFPSGPAYYMMGFDIDMFTPFFVMARITGWTAHIMEQQANNRLIRPLSKYTGPGERHVVPLRNEDELMSQIDSGLAANAPDVEADIQQSRHYNDDLAPVPASRRKWGMLSFAALWISMSACIPTYMLASGLISGGMNWSQAILTIFLANVIVLIPMILNAHAGTLYGIPFPVYCRASFGILGANVPAILRALVACGWFGIQTWIGGEAIYKICITIFNITPSTATNWLGITGGQFACFLFFWAINMVVIYRGIDTIRWLLNIKAPLLIALGLLFLFWAYRKAGGFGPILSQPSQFDAGQPKEGQFWKYFFPALTGMVGFWATLSLNIPDFSRYAKTQRDQIFGQAIGLPLTMALYSFIGVAVTSATKIIFGKTIWDPVDVLTHFENRAVLVFAMVALCLATLATNIAANVVSPANDFSHLSPRTISFRTGGFITGFVGIMMMPWKLLANPDSYIFQWLGGYGALLGPIGGVLIADYFVIRRCKLSLGALYSAEGEYLYKNGFSYVAIIAFVLGVLPSLPGFLVTVHQLDPASVPAGLVSLFDYAWFIGFALAFVIYLVLRKLAPKL